MNMHRCLYFEDGKGGQRGQENKRAQNIGDDIRFINKYKGVDRPSLKRLTCVSLSFILPLSFSLLTSSLSSSSKSPPEYITRERAKAQILLVSSHEKRYIPSPMKLQFFI